MPTTTLSRKVTFIANQGFEGGLSSENAIAVAKSQMVVADNILIGTAITRRNRGGQELYHTGSFASTVSYPISGEPIRGIHEYWRTASVAGNPIGDLFLHQDTKVWSIDDRNTAAIDRTGSLTLSPLSVPCYQPFEQQIYFCSTITADGYNKWDGASSTAVAATPPPDGPGKYLCTHFARMVMAGNDDFPFRVYLSAPNDAEEWSSMAGGTSLDLDADGDPEGITGLVSFQNRLYVFTRRSTYEITGTTPATFVVLRVSNGIGCIGHASIAVTPNDVIFASDRGVHSLKQLDSGRQTEANFLSRDIQKLWVTLTNATRFKQFMAAYDENINSYVMCVCSGSDLGNKDMLVFNIEYGTWTQWKEINARSITVSLLNNRKQLLIGKEDGRIAYLNRPDRIDFDTTYSARFKTGVLYPGEIDRERRFIAMTILASTDRPVNIQVSWDIDGKRNGTTTYQLDAAGDLLGTTFVLGTSQLGIGQYVPTTVSIDEVGYGIQLDVAFGGGADVEIYGFILEVEDTNPNYGGQPAS